MNGTSFLSDLLTAAKVRHTGWYSDAEFDKMPFRTLFGLSKVLEPYNIGCMGLALGDKSQIERLPLPFVAQTPRGLVIVTDADNQGVNYLSQGVSEHATLDEFVGAMTGNVLVLDISRASIEPDYSSHRFTMIANKMKKWVLVACCMALFAWLFVTNRLYDSWSTIVLTAINLVGVYIGFLLVQKSAHIKSRHADAVCSVVEAGGCDDVLSTAASKFFGIFGWSEVGLAYFSVSLLCLLVFPQYIGALALFNLICLPFSFWSVWYQRFKAHTWCTLCLCVQSMLWLLFACYLGGGWYRQILPIKPEYALLAVTYVAVMLGINALMPLLDRKNVNSNN